VCIYALLDGCAEVVHPVPQRRAGGITSRIFNDFDSDLDDVQLMTSSELEAGMKNRGLSFYARYQRESQSQTGIFVVEEHNGTNVETVRCRRGVANQRWTPKVRNKNDTMQPSQLLYKISTKFQKLHPHFWVQRHGKTCVNTYRHRCGW